MATVYLAEDLKHGRKVAVNVLKPFLPVRPFGGRRSGILYVSWVTLADDPRHVAWLERQLVSDVFEVKNRK